MIQKHLDLISLITDMRLEIKGKMFWQMVFEEIVKPQTQGKSKIEMNKFIQHTFVKTLVCAASLPGAKETKDGEILVLV